MALFAILLVAQLVCYLLAIHYWVEMKAAEMMRDEEWRSRR